MVVDRDVKEGMSWWEFEHFLKDVDYSIIGSGIVGLSTAIELKNIDPNSKVLIIDKKTLPIGASTKNAGFACFGSISEILDDFETYGEAICQKLIQMRWEGLSALKTRVSAHKMNYEESPGAEFFSSNEEEEIYRSKISWANSFVGSIVGNENCFHSQIGDFGYEIVNNLEGCLNPQLMMSELENIARKLGVLFMSGVEVNKINYKNKILKSSVGSLTFNKLFICTNGFSQMLLPNKDIQPARNQVLITNRIPDFRLSKCYHMNKGYVYFREYDGRLLIGGGRHIDKNGEATTKLGNTEAITSYLNGIIQKHIFSDQPYEIEHCWSGILGVGESKMPIVKMIEQDVCVAVRMGGMGVAIGSFIGKVASSMIQSIDNRAHQLYVS